MERIFSAILLDLCVQLCYDSVKTYQTFKGLTKEKGNSFFRCKIQTESKHTYYQHNFPFSTVAALQRSVTEGGGKLEDRQRCSGVGYASIDGSPHFDQ